MIRQINFTGIKNIGYARLFSSEDQQPFTRDIINMELTNDAKNKDLFEYQKLVADYPAYKNDINDKYLNLEFEAKKMVGYNVGRLKINGKVLHFKEEENRPILNFVKGMVDKVSKLKINDFKKDKMYLLSKEAQNGFIYNEDPIDYISGFSGHIDFIEGTDLANKLENLYNAENLTEAQAKKLFRVTDDIIDILHDPLYVHNGSVYMKALLKQCDTSIEGS